MCIITISRRSLLFVALLTVLLPALHAAPAGLTAAAGLATVIDGPAAAHYDFGVRRLSDETPLVHIFVLQNSTATPIILDRLQTSCGCTTAVAGASNALPLTVAPGQTVPIRIQISLRRLLPGDLHKFVWAYTHGPVNATTLLEMRGMIQDDAAPGVPKAPAVATTIAAPEIGSRALPFACTDTAGRRFTLSARLGQPIALFFFCGCPWCADVARSWGRLQRAGALPTGTQTVIIFAGGKSAAQAFAAANALAMSRTTMLPDPDGRLTEGLYKVTACPRIFALDPKGAICYTNTHPDDQPRQAPAKVLVNRLQQSLRHRL